VIIRLLAGRKRRSGGESRESLGPSDDAKAACEQMRRRMVEAGAGIERGG
jgi:hypothetical protein